MTCNSPDILAAHLAVGNTILGILVSFDNLFAMAGFTFDPYAEMITLCELCMSKESADFHEAVTRAAHISALRGDIPALQKIFKYTLESSGSGTLVLLNKLPTIFPTRGQRSHIKMFQVYALVFEYGNESVYRAVNSLAVRAAALRNISAIIDGIDDIASMSDEIYKVVRVAICGNTHPILSLQLVKVLGVAIYVTAIDKDKLGQVKKLLQFGDFLWEEVNSQNTVSGYSGVKNAKC